MRILLILFIVVLVTGCGVSKSSVTPNKKYSPQQVQKDYAIYQSILEESHPGIYWYTSKDSMDEYFRIGAERLKDSLNEPQFRKVLNWITSKIECGHTAVRFSKGYSRYADTVRTKIFPLSVKIWSTRSVQTPPVGSPEEDTMAVAANLNRRDTIFKRGAVIKKINGKPIDRLVDTMFEYMTTDGFNRTHKYQTLSNRGSFGNLYTTLFGLSEKYTIDYLDSAGRIRTAVIPVYNPSADSLLRAAIRPISGLPQPSRKERRERQLNTMRQLRIDSVNHTAFMDLGSFSRSYHLKKFFRNSFRFLKNHHIRHLIIDVRGNGGGSVSNSTKLARYLADRRFKIADSLYAPRKKTTYGRYIQNDFFNRLFMTFLTRQRKDGYYHFGYFERHYFKPRKSDHYGGKTYILIGGNSFSATTLFASALIGQDNVTVVGEETGGGAYGNSAWLLPDVTLPETKVRIRLPLFRLVIDKNIPKNGRGVQPEVEVFPTVDAVRRGSDYKLDKVMELIKKDKESGARLLRR